jgi:hypothetical protein
MSDDEMNIDDGMLLGSWCSSPNCCPSLQSRLEVLFAAKDAGFRTQVILHCFRRFPWVYIWLLTGGNEENVSSKDITYDRVESNVDTRAARCACARVMILIPPANLVPLYL